MIGGKVITNSLSADLCFSIPAVCSRDTWHFVRVSRSSSVKFRAYRPIVHKLIQFSGKNPTSLLIIEE